MTYTDTLSLFCQLAGLDPDTLTDVDKATFNDLFNRWLRRGWRHYPWPALITYEKHFVDPAGIVPFDKGDLLGVFPTDPREVREPYPLPHRIIQTGIIVGKAHATVWLSYRPPPPRYTASAPAIEVPDFLADFTAHGVYLDWLRGEGQQGKASIEKRDPWDWLYDEIDALERTHCTRRWRVLKA
jgi:hypothetical protein